MTTAQDIINKFNLQPHPEGGYFEETYRSKGEIPNEALSQEYKDSRNYSTAIYFLLTSDQFSAFHKIKQDEIWHFYKGSPIRIHMISAQGVYSNVVVGRDLSVGQVPQYVIKGGVWFAAEVVEKDSFSFVGCTVSPGFDFQDLDMPRREFLLGKYPELEEVILKFTNSDD